MNQCPRSRIGYPMCFQGGFGDFFSFYVLESSSQRSIRSGMREASKRDCEGKQCCCCPHFPRPSSGGGEPPSEKGRMFLDSHPFWKGKKPNTKKGGRRVIPPRPLTISSCTPLLTSQTSVRHHLVDWSNPKINFVSALHKHLFVLVRVIQFVCGPRINCCVLT